MIDHMVESGNPHGAKLEETGGTEGGVAERGERACVATLVYDKGLEKASVMQNGGKGRGHARL